MRSHKLDTTLLAVASPSSYVSVWAEPDNLNPNYQIVPLKTLENVFYRHGRLGRENLVRTFLAQASEEDKISVVLGEGEAEVNGKEVPLGYDAWESWLKTKQHGDEILFEPIPGFGATIEVEYLGDAYRWTTRDSRSGRAGGSFLRRIIEKCVKDEETRSSYEQPPTPVKDISIFFTLPKVEEGRQIILDVGQLASIIRSVFDIRVDTRALTKSLAESFSSGSRHDRSVLCNGNDERGLAVQGILTGRNAYTDAQIKEMTTSNNRSWEEYVMSGCSFETLPRLAALQKVSGSKIYFNSSVGSGDAPEIELRIYTSYRQVNKKQSIGVYAQQELLRERILPKLALAIARLHRPDIFGV